MLGVPIYTKGLEGFMMTYQQVLLSSATDNIKISATSTHGLVSAKDNKEYKKILTAFDYCLPDGKPLTWVSRLKKQPVIQCRGVDIMEAVMCASSSSFSPKHFLCGSTPACLEKLQENFKKKNPFVQITGTYSPPFAPTETYDYALIVKKIEESQAEVVWLGVSTPKQEMMAHLLSQHVKVKMIFTVGAAFDFHAGILPMTPSIFVKIGFEWLFRCIIQPKLIYERYIFVIPKFIYYLLKDLSKI